jgi:hypothetical protein
MIVSEKILGVVKGTNAELVADNRIWPTGWIIKEIDGNGDDTGVQYVGDGVTTFSNLAAGSVQSVISASAGALTWGNILEKPALYTESEVDSLVSSARSGAISDLRNGVVTAGDDLAKLYTLIQNINTVLTSDETTLDELQEIVDYIQQNKSDLENLGIANIAGLQSALNGKISLGQAKNEILTGFDITGVSGDVAATDSILDAIHKLQVLINDLEAAGYLTDAPSDGDEYVRKDGAWAVSSGGGGGGVANLPLQINFDSDLDTASAQVTFKGAKTFSDLFFDSKLTAVTFEVKLSSSSTWTAQADITALNSWVTSNVTTSSTLWQIRMIADFGSNTGEADATLIYT